MAKNMTAEELAYRTFLITMAATIAYVVSVFLFVL